MGFEYFWGVVRPEQCAGLALAASSIIYLLLALWRVAQYRAPPPAGLLHRPPISVLKPLCGAEPGLYQCLRSFCTQDYPIFQVVFGVSHAGDPAIAVVHRLMGEFPGRDLALVVDPGMVGTNLKVSNLVNMHRAAKHDVIVISDSDTLVRPDCLLEVAAPLADPATGAVTCLYKAAPLPGLASRLGALFINDWFLSSAIVDAGMRGVAYCFGPVTALRRAALEAAGGFIALASHLADDFLLGRRIAAAGYRVRLAGGIVDTVVAESFRSLFQHELRWARTVRSLKPMEHALSLVTQPLPLLLLLLAPRPSLLGVAALAAALSLRLALHVLIARRLCPGAALQPWLVPLRECLCFTVWAASFLDSRVRWRGQPFRIGPAGILVPLEPPAAVSAALGKRAAEAA